MDLGQHYQLWNLDKEKQHLMQYILATSPTTLGYTCGLLDYVSISLWYQSVLPQLLESSHRSYFLRKIKRSNSSVPTDIFHVQQSEMAGGNCLELVDRKYFHYHRNFYQRTQIVFSISTPPQHTHFRHHLGCHSHALGLQDFSRLGWLTKKEVEVCLDADAVDNTLQLQPRSQITTHRGAWRIEAYAFNIIMIAKTNTSNFNSTHSSLAYFHANNSSSKN